MQTHEDQPKSQPWWMEFDMDTPNMSTNEPRVEPRTSSSQPWWMEFDMDTPNMSINQPWWMEYKMNAPNMSINQPWWMEYKRTTPNTPINQPYAQHEPSLFQAGRMTYHADTAIPTLGGPPTIQPHARLDVELPQFQRSPHIMHPETQISSAPLEEAHQIVPTSISFEQPHGEVSKLTSSANFTRTPKFSKASGTTQGAPAPVTYASVASSKANRQSSVLPAPFKEPRSKKWKAPRPTYLPENFSMAKNSPVESSAPPEKTGKRRNRPNRPKPTMNPNGSCSRSRFCCQPPGVA
ncbi:hypothetical protein DM02DRAFT_201748 [Periconia macrospinosa]|uniref:Uncharacterized protein n=1 Tax=Periconia macrospinosa TaxID=97972 RepID=A0A2V1E0N3_9PLEO|nr:hypothetical protein DM02DRAFT_201748 [Periconia macrospinosa]